MEQRYRRGECRESGHHRREQPLPAQYFTDPNVWEVEKDKVFSSYWVYASHANSIEESGQYFTRTIGGRRRGQSSVAVSRAAIMSAARTAQPEMAKPTSTMAVIQTYWPATAT